MSLKISEIAKTIGGYTFRKSIESDKSGNVFVLQANNINNGKNIENTDDFIKTSFQGFRTATFLQKNDIVLVSRGTGFGSFRSVVFLSGDSNVIASSSLFIVRLLNKNILPDYLTLYLNSSEGQNKLLKIASGSHFQAIPRKEFDNIDIPIPTLEKQKLMIDLNDNIKKQQDLVSRKYKIMENIINQSFTSLNN